MFTPNSRYYSLKKAIYKGPDGRETPYVTRRLLPQGSAMNNLVNYPVKSGDRLDLLAAYALGNSELYWKICDANNAMNPFEVIETGVTASISIPQA